jgi:hypothetical protein
VVKRGTLLAVLLVAGCTPHPDPAAPAPAPVTGMVRHRLVLPDGHWPVLVRRVDPVAHTVAVDLITLSGPPSPRITGADPVMRTMTVAGPVAGGLAALAAGPASGPYLLTVRHGRITGIHEIARP